uniref:Uncharacterized protein n=1 Tax=Zea mays TaxID=4577 RepID=C4J102_MAIZE|nr:unknown [Zea mays]
MSKIKTHTAIPAPVTNLISEQCVNEQYAGTKSSLETNTSRHCKIQAVPPEMCSLQDQ